MKYPLDEMLKDYSYISMGVAIGGWEHLTSRSANIFGILGVALYIGSLVAYFFKRKKEDEALRRRYP